LDCGAKISPGYARCFSCGSLIENQKDRTKKEQHIKNKGIKKKQRIRKKEYRKRDLKKWKDRKKKELKNDVPYLIGGLFVSLITGLILF